MISPMQFIEKEAIKVAIIGDKKSGKSTLTQLLASKNYCFTDQSQEAERKSLLSKVEENLKKREAIVHELIGFNRDG